ncbi:MAG: hypothetical protein MJY89_00450 [Bacteroidales bacterium]|nr:hypothetical protein [Bacteroidales bacterium]
MRRFVFIFQLLLLAFGANAGSPYFATREGTVMSYVRRNASEDKVVWKYTVSVNEVHPDGIDFTYDFHRPGGGQMYGGPLNMFMSLDEDGNISMDVAATVKNFVHNIFPQKEIWSEGGETQIPSSMRPGDVLPDVRAKARVLGMNYNVDINGRSVLRSETISTPAGTFDCLVVEEHKVESGLGRNRDIRTLTWYSAGIGEVRHESYDWKTQKLLTVEVLESIE